MVVRFCQGDILGGDLLWKEMEWMIKNYFDHRFLSSFA